MARASRAELTFNPADALGLDGRIDPLRNFAFLGDVGFRRRDFFDVVRQAVEHDTLGAITQRIAVLVLPQGDLEFADRRIRRVRDHIGGILTQLIVGVTAVGLIETLHEQRRAAVGRHQLGQLEEAPISRLRGVLDQLVEFLHRGGAAVAVEQAVEIGIDEIEAPSPAIFGGPVFAEETARTCQASSPGSPCPATARWHVGDVASGRHMLILRLCVAVVQDVRHPSGPVAIGLLGSSLTERRDRLVGGAVGGRKAELIRIEDCALRGAGNSAPC